MPRSKSGLWKNQVCERIRSVEESGQIWSKSGQNQVKYGQNQVCGRSMQTAPPAGLSAAAGGICVLNSSRVRPHTDGACLQLGSQPLQGAQPQALQMLQTAEGSQVASSGTGRKGVKGVLSGAAGRTGAREHCACQDRGCLMTQSPPSPLVKCSY
jgi:hypothetical protein